jgi:hypothetical protein
MRPVKALNERPDGRVGLIAKLSIGPPVGTMEGPTKYAPTVAVSLPLVKVNAGEATAGLGVGEAVAGESPVRPEIRRTKVRNLKNELFFVMFVLELLKIGIAHHNQNSPNARQARHGETRKWYPSGKGFVRSSSVSEFLQYIGINI